MEIIKKFIGEKLLDHNYDFSSCPNYETFSLEYKQMLAEKLDKVLDLLNNKDIIGSNNSEYGDLKKKTVEDRIMQELKNYPELMSIIKVNHIKNDDTNSKKKEIISHSFIGETALFRGYDKVTKACLLSHSANILQDTLGRNLGMLCALAHRPELSEIALKDPFAPIMQDYDGNTIGMHLVKEVGNGDLPLEMVDGYISVIKKSMNINESLIRQNNDERTIGMLIAERMKEHPKLTDLFHIAAEHDSARRIETSMGNNILDLALMHGGYSEEECIEKYNYSNKDRVQRRVNKEIDFELSSDN